MKKIIVVAGATGNLGERIIKALLERGVEVRTNFANSPYFKMITFAATNFVN